MCNYTKWTHSVSLCPNTIPGPVQDNLQLLFSNCQNSLCASIRRGHTPLSVQNTVTCPIQDSLEKNRWVDFALEHLIVGHRFSECLFCSVPCVSLKAGVGGVGGGVHYPLRYRFRGVMVHLTLYFATKARACPCDYGHDVAKGSWTLASFFTPLRQLFMSSTKTEAQVRFCFFSSCRLLRCVRVCVFRLAG